MIKSLIRYLNEKFADRNDVNTPVMVFIFFIRQTLIFESFLRIKIKNKVRLQNGVKLIHKI